MATCCSPLPSPGLPKTVPSTPLPRHGHPLKVLWTVVFPRLPTAALQLCEMLASSLHRRGGSLPTDPALTPTLPVCLGGLFQISPQSLPRPPTDGPLLPSSLPPGLALNSLFGSPPPSLLPTCGLFQPNLKVSPLHPTNRFPPHNFLSSSTPRVCISFPSGGWVSFQSFPVLPPPASAG